MEEVNSRKEVNEEELFNKKNIPTTGSFFKFNKIGDRINGILVSTGELVKSNDPTYKDQWVYILENVKGVQTEILVDEKTGKESFGETKPYSADSVKVALSINRKVAIEKANKANPGQTVGFRYESDFITPEMIKQKKHAFKVIEVYVK